VSESTIEDISDFSYWNINKTLELMGYRIENFTGLSYVSREFNLILDPSYLQLARPVQFPSKSRAIIAHFIPFNFLEEHRIAHFGQQHFWENS
jgi:hypothetical protein